MRHIRRSGAWLTLFAALAAVFAPALPSHALAAGPDWQHEETRSDLPVWLEALLLLLSLGHFILDVMDEVDEMTEGGSTPPPQPPCPVWETCENP